VLYSGSALVEDGGSVIGPAGAAQPAACDGVDALAAGCPKGLAVMLPPTPPVPNERRAYSDRAIAEAPEIPVESGNGQQAAENAGVPRGALSACKSRCLNNDEFAERIDAKLQESGK